MTWMMRRDFNMTAAIAAATPPALIHDDSGAGKAVRQDLKRKMLPRVEFQLVDVFSKEPFSGNGLVVFTSKEKVLPDMMQALTREMRQFESIFLESTINPNVVRARVFTMEEELDFAGHPLLGAAAVLHQKRFPQKQTASWTIELRHKTVPITTTRETSWYGANMDQGQAEFGRTLSIEESRPFLEALNLTMSQISQSLPLQQVSTGLPYLIVPISNGLENARIVQPGFASLLTTVGAKFVYVLDVKRREGRTWDNQGLVEDVATGSAAGPAGAYLVRQKLLNPGQKLVLRQGRFVGRPSKLFVTVQADATRRLNVSVAGDVHLIARGRLGA
jgi:PhzF family phenazine biosynthesis protein